MPENKKITLQEILYWIVDNSDDTEAMDRINKTTFPFTQFYIQRWGKAHSDEEDREDGPFDGGL